MTIISQHFLQILHISGKPLQPYQMIPGFPCEGGCSFQGVYWKDLVRKAIHPCCDLCCVTQVTLDTSGEPYTYHGWSRDGQVMSWSPVQEEIFVTSVGEIQNMILSTHLVDWKQSWWFVAFPSSICDSNWWTSRLQHTQRAEEGLQGI